MLELGFFGHESADGTAFSERIRRHYTNRGWRTWSVGEALLASQGTTIDADGDRRGLARVTAASRDHPLAHVARRRDRRALRAGRAEGVRREREAVVVTADFGLREGRADAS